MRYLVRRTDYAKLTAFRFWTLQAFPNIIDIKIPRLMSSCKLQVEIEVQKDVLKSTSGKHDKFCKEWSQHLQAANVSGGASCLHTTSSHLFS